MVFCCPNKEFESAKSKNKQKISGLAIINQELKIKILNYHLAQNNIVISKDIFWYLLESLDDRSIFFHNELNKICFKKNISYSFRDIKKIINQISKDDLDIMTVRVEHTDNVTNAVQHAIQTECEIRAEVEVLQPGTMPKTEFKANRIRDERIR